MKRDAEHELVAAMLLGQDIEGAAFVKPSDFHDPRLEAIWQAGWDVIDGGGSIDLASMESALRGLERWEVVGGWEGLSAYTDATTWISPAAVHDLARVVKRDSRLSDLYVLGRELAELTQDEGADPDVLLTEFSARLEARDTGRDVPWVPLHEAAKIKLDEVRAEEKGEAERIRMPSGLSGVDEYLRGGFRPAWLVGLAGTEKMGKTALAAKIARSTAGAGFPTLFYSKEMLGVELAERELSARAGVSAESIDTHPSAEEWSRLMRAHDDMRSEPFDTLTKVMTWRDFCSTARRWRRMNRASPSGMIVIDYLQLLDVQRTRGDTREQALGMVSREAKSLAIELYCCVVLLAQLNDGEIARRDDKRPRASDLRESKGLNKDANALVAVHRPCVYSTKAPREAAEIHFLRNRHGKWPVLIPCKFDEKTTLFKDTRE